MKKILKWVGIVLGVLVLLVLVAAAVLYLRGTARLNKRYELPVVAIPIPTDSASIARGHHLVHAVTLCEGCHGDNLGGGTVFEAPLIVRVDASNLTSGQGGVGGTYSDADFVRAIRQGVNREGRGLMIMHSDGFHNLSEADLASIIAYVKSAPPVDNPVPKTQGKPLGKIFLALGMFDNGPMPLIPAEIIDHDAPFRPAPPPGVTAEYGEYLVSIALCHMCHGADLTGGPPIEEDTPPPPTLRQYGAPGGWSAEQLVNTLRTGVTPYGRTLDGDVMPFKVYGNMTDDEIAAIWSYIGSLSEH